MCSGCNVLGGSCKCDGHYTRPKGAKHSRTGKLLPRKSVGNCLTALPTWKAPCCGCTVYSQEKPRREKFDDE